MVVHKKSKSGANPESRIVTKIQAIKDTRKYKEYTKIQALYIHECKRGR